jgi:hypothetical protein
LFAGAVMLHDDDLMDWEDGEPFPRCPELRMAEDLVDYLLTLGVDLRKSNGQPLQVTQPIALTVECAVRKLHGCKMADLENAAAEKAGLQIQNQIRSWKSGRQEAAPKVNLSARDAAEALFKPK